MKAIVYHGPMSLMLEEVQIPDIEENEVLLKVEMVGICGSEIEGYVGKSSVRKPPLIMGHEFCGIVESVGLQVDEWKNGERAVINPLLSCGFCYYCQSGKGNVCPERKLIGIHRPGAFGEYVAVPQQALYRISSELDSRLMTLAEPTAVCLHGLFNLRSKPFNSMVVFGAGAIGLITLQIAMAMGYGPITVVDINENRLQHAKRLGAVNTVTPDQLNKDMSELFAVAVDCTGSSSARQLCMNVVQPGGEVLLMGLGHDSSELAINDLIRREISIMTSYSYTHRDFQSALMLLLEGKINIEGWTLTSELSHAPKIFEELVGQTVTASKVFLKPRP